MSNDTHSLFASHAWLRSGWHRDVLFQWDEAGTLTHVEPGASPDCHPQAAGPVIPGMPNLHSHAFQRAMAGLTEYRANAADNFWSWRDLMYRFAGKITPDILAAVAQWLYIEMLKSGYTSVCEFHYVHHQADGSQHPRAHELAMQVVDAAASTGIGMTMLPVLYQFSGIGGQPPRDDQRRFINSSGQLLELLAGLRQARPESNTRRYGVAPHSIRAVTDSTLKHLIDGLNVVDSTAPIHIHVAEQTAEVDASVAGLGKRPVRWLLDNFDISSRWCLVHATHVDAEETAMLAESGAVAGLCLTTEANLGDGFFPADHFLERNGRFGIGSDSHIAVDWRSELRLLEYGQRLSRRERNVLALPGMPQVADRLFAGALDGGAKATGRGVGALAVGLCADFMVLDADHPAIAVKPQDTWLSSVVFAEHGETPVRDVFVHGAKLVENRRHRDEEIAYSAYKRALTELLRP